MSTSEPTPGVPVSVDQLIALNDEMSALVRAGVPLERGLIDAGRELGGRLGRITTNLGNRLADGEELTQALNDPAHPMPAIYRAVVEAGIRSGRLAKALEGMARIARGYGESRRVVGMALLYPVLVMILAYALFVVFVVQIAPRFVEGFDSLGLPSSLPIRFMEGAGATIWYWAPVVPVLFLILGFRWVFSGRSTSLDGTSISSAMGLIRPVGRMLADYRSANFAELLALLIEHQVPLEEAVRLAGEASGNRSFRRAASSLADQLRQGVTGVVEDRGLFPPLLAWMISAGHRQASLPLALVQIAHTYRSKAEARARMLQAGLPTLLMLTIGGGTVLCYGVTLFVPLTALWESLAAPTQ